MGTGEVDDEMRFGEDPESAVKCGICCVEPRLITPDHSIQTA